MDHPIVGLHYALTMCLFYSIAHIALRWTNHFSFAVVKWVSAAHHAALVQIYPMGGDSKSAVIVKSVQTENSIKWTHAASSRLRLYRRRPGTRSYHKRSQFLP